MGSSYCPIRIYRPLLKKHITKQVHHIQPELLMSAMATDSFLVSSCAQCGCKDQMSCVYLVL